jgi:hypothetical protein
VILYSAAVKVAPYKIKKAAAPILLILGKSLTSKFKSDTNS